MVLLCLLHLRWLLVWKHLVVLLVKIFLLFALNLEQVEVNVTVLLDGVRALSAEVRLLSEVAY